MTGADVSQSKGRFEESTCGDCPFRSKKHLHVIQVFGSCRVEAVSYTHLDVYKRQFLHMCLRYRELKAF